MAEAATMLHISNPAGSRPTTPVQELRSPTSTPATTPNRHGKRPMNSLDTPSQSLPPVAPLLDAPPSTLPHSDNTSSNLKKNPTSRRGAHLEAARTSVNIWRHRNKPRFMTVEAFMSDRIWRTLSGTRYTSVNDLAKAVPWVYAERHGDALLQVLEHVDNSITQEKQEKKDAEARRRAEQAAARDEEKRRAQEAKKEEKQQKDAEKARVAEEKRKQKAAKELNKLAKESAQAAKKQKKENDPAALAASSPAFRVSARLFMSYQ